MSVLSFFSGLDTPWFGNAFSKDKAKPTEKTKPGHVYLVGAGPGDPELLTIKAYKVLQSADVVLYDSLVSNDILGLLSTHCQPIFVGKRAGKHSMPQSEICELLTKYALQGLNVVRLKGGDPSIFARINEEANALAKANVEFAIVPGITTACAASAYTGIPLTARGVAKSVTFLTAQFANPKQQPNWQQYQFQAGKDNPTLVVYMGLNRLNQLTQGLLNVGWPKETPIALIENATTSKQRVITSLLADVETVMNRQQLTGPTLIVIGEVINQTMPISQRLMEQASA